MPVDTQENPRVQFGTSAEITAERVQEGGIISVDSTDVVRITRKDLTQLIVGGSGGLAGKYWVNVAGQQPVTTYTTITSAIAAAVADGHSAAHPAVIWVLPGAYVESFALPAGISIQGMVQDFGDLRDGIGNLPSITGGITFSPAGAGSSSLSNLVLNGFIQISGATAVGLVLDHVAIAQTDTAINPLLITNALASVTLKTCSLGNLAGSTAGVINAGAAATVSAHDTQLTADADQFCVLFTAGGVVSLRNCVTQGFFSLAGAVVARFIDVSFVTNTATFTLANSANMILTRCAITSGGGNMATGSTSSSVTTYDCNYPQSLLGMSATIPTTAQYTNRIYTELVKTGAGPYTITKLFDTFLIDTAAGGAGNKVFTLPALSTVPTGTRITFQKIISTANTVTLTRFAGETINGVAADLVLAAGSLTGATLQASLATLDWRVVASVDP